MVNPPILNQECAPFIASLMIEKYLRKELSKKGKKKEKQVLDAIILDKHSDFK